MTLKNKNSYLKDWSLEVVCTGTGGSNARTPCRNHIHLKRENILKRKYLPLGMHKTVTDFGFICQKCNCFTLIDKELIPLEIRKSL